MNVLVITRNAWDDTNSIGNTMSNFFGGLENVNTANIYFRSSKPNNRVCTKYFHVTEQQLIRNLFTPEKCGNAFEYSYAGEEKSGYSSEKKLISVIHKFGIKGVYALSDKLWDEKKWLNKRFDDFIEGFDPDVVFTFVKALPQYYHTIKHLHEKHHKKIIVWIADDEYTVLSQSPLKKDKKKIERLRYILNIASAVWGCSKEMCEYYNSVFGCNAKPLYKSCSFDFSVRTSVNTPVRLVYAGNLLFGRIDILKRVIKQLEKINKNGTAAVLDIYSSTPVAPDEKNVLQQSGAVRFHGVKPYSEIQKIMSDSDLVLHIESFDEKEIIKTKYSFSTKIIDCLQSGSVMLAIGPGEIASIKYAKTIPGAFVIDSPNDISAKLSEVIGEKDSYPKRAESIRDFAEKNHGKEPNRCFVFD